jgi:hypothetical protein
MIKHKNRNWIVDGNRQIKDGATDESENTRRKPYNETLEQELLRTSRED